MRVVEPEAGRTPFTCPQCGTLAAQEWLNLAPGQATEQDFGGRGWNFRYILDDYQWCTCAACDRPSLWSMVPVGNSDIGEVYEWRLVWPISGGPEPHDDMPATAVTHYQEARAVLGASPRAAAAILRVSAEALVQSLLSRDDVTLNDGIGELVRSGRIRSNVQKACDILRVTGNDVLHPGQIDQRDTSTEVAGALFRLLNLIVEQAITEPRVVDELYSSLPSTKRDAIDRRDGRAATPSPTQPA